MRHAFDLNPGYRWSVECNAWVPGVPPIVAAAIERDAALDRYIDMMLEDAKCLKTKPK
jgi:hypothetical protein